MDADKEGFLRSGRSLTQTAGRAARNINGRVIFYADEITGSMQRTMDETDRRREKQIAYNEKHGITPQALKKEKFNIMSQTKVADGSKAPESYLEEKKSSLAADPVVAYMNKDQLEKAIRRTRKEMEKAAKDMDFMEAARLRDEMFELQELLEKKS
jgi:excinuclease ABC subunit B